jgi:hypothetical protein
MDELEPQTDGRPSEVPAAVLDVACHGWGNPRGRVEVERFERPRSTVFRVVDPESPEQFMSYAKQTWLGGMTPQRAEAARDRAHFGLAAAQEVGPVVTDLLRAQGFNVAMPIAVEAEGMWSVTNGLPGVPLGQILGRHRAPAAICEQLGRVARSFDDGTAGHVPASRTAALWSAFDGDIKRSVALLGGADGRWLAAEGSRLRAVIEAPEALVLAHGDLGPTNVLSDGGTLTIIDVGFLPALVGFDVFKLWSRLSVPNPAAFLSSAGTLDALLAGYGAIDPLRRSALDAALLQRISRDAVKLSSRRRRAWGRWQLRRFVRRGRAGSG